MTGVDRGLYAILTMAGYVAMLARKFVTEPISSGLQPDDVTVNKGRTAGCGHKR